MASRTGTTRDRHAGLRARLGDRTLPTPSDVDSELRRLAQDRAEGPTRSVRERAPGRAEPPPTASSDPPRKARASRPGSGSRRRARRHRAIAITLLACAALSLAAAFAQMRMAQHLTTGTIVLAVDVSRSMNATDVYPDRLGAAVEAGEAFLEQLPPGFEVGLVTFGSDASAIVEPTATRATLLGALDGLTSASDPGTAIAGGLSTAIETITSHASVDDEHRAAIVLLTDGRDSGGTTSQVDGAIRAKDEGIRVFTVSITPTGSSTADADTEVLRRMAETTGAETFTAGSAEELARVYSALGSRMSSTLEVGDHAGPFVVAASILLLLALVVILMGSREPYAAKAKAPSPRTRRSPSRTPQHRRPRR